MVYYRKNRKTNYRKKRGYKKLRQIKKTRRFKKSTYRWNAGGNLRMLRNPLHVRKTVVLKQTYVNSCVVPPITFTSSNMNKSIGLFLNSPHIFVDGGANGFPNSNPPAPSGIIWSTTVQDQYGSGNVCDTLVSYNAGDNWAYKYKTGQVIGTHLEINVRCLRDDHNADDAAHCPLAISLTKQAMPGMSKNNTPEVIRNRPYTQTKLVNTDTKEGNAECGFKLKHSIAKFNQVSKNFIGNSNYIFNTGNSPSGIGGSSGVPSEIDYSYLVISPMCSAMINSAVARNTSPQIVISLKRTSWVRYSEPAMASNQPNPQ